MKVGVIGGGITGLSLAHYIDDIDIIDDIEIFEREKQPGGVIKSEEINEKIVEHGPQRIRLTQNIKSLIDDLGLKNELIKTENLPLYIYHNGRLKKAPLSIKDFLLGDILSPFEKIRFLKGIIDDKKGETLGEELSKKFGTSAYKKFLGPIFGGLYGENPKDMYNTDSMFSVRKFIFSKMPPAASFKQGLQTLPETLYKKYKNKINLNKKVKKIEQKNNKYLLYTYNKTEKFDKIIFTTPASEVYNILKNLPNNNIKLLDNLNYNNIILVYLYSEFDIEALGYQVSFDEDIYTLGVTANTSLFKHNRGGLYTCFLGGAWNPGLIEKPDKKLGEIASREFKKVTGHNSEFIGLNKTKMPSRDLTWKKIQEIELPDGIYICSNYTGSPGIPSRLRHAKKLANELKSYPNKN